MSSNQHSINDKIKGVHRSFARSKQCLSSGTCDRLTTLNNETKFASWRIKISIPFLLNLLLVKQVRTKQGDVIPDLSMLIK